MDKVVSFERKPGCERRECDDCGAQDVTRRVERQDFIYGIGDSAADLVAMVPVWRCGACGSAYTDEEGRVAQHEAVCRHLRVLTPAEVKAIRGPMSRQEFHALTGIAEASMKRWENGEQIQTTAMDTLLRLAGDPTVADRLRDIRRSVGCADKPVPLTPGGAGVQTPAREHEGQRPSCA